MKTVSMIVAAASILLGNAAWADETRKPNPYTVEQINRALEFFGQPSLGTSRILHNDRDGSRDKETTKTFTESTITYHSGNK